jgi:starch phosphorylase
VPGPSPAHLRLHQPHPPAGGPGDLAARPVPPPPAAHLEIIFEINRRFLESVRARFPDDPERIARLSLIDEPVTSDVRMANLACVGSQAGQRRRRAAHRTVRNTSSAISTDLWPEKFSNKTNGVTPRRFIALANPTRHLIRARSATGWAT